MISVITSYYNRPENLKTFVEVANKVGNTEIEFVLVNYDFSDTEVQRICEFSKIRVIQCQKVRGQENYFNTAMLHNLAVRNSIKPWILKQDIDLVIYPEFYTELVGYLKTSNPDYLIIGCKYLNTNVIDISEFTKDSINKLSRGRLENDWNCGNMYVVRKEIYELLHGEDERFVGYGMEDYDFIYRLVKYYNPQFKLNTYRKGEIHHQIRDLIVKPKNKEIFDETGWCFLHLKHPRSNENKYRDFIRDNINLLEKKVMENM